MRDVTLFTAVMLSFLGYSTVCATDDPMRPIPRPDSVQRAPVAAPAPAPRRDWVLTSTLVGNTRRVAVINDRLVSVGDEVLGARVIGIDARSAQLRYEGQELVLHLGEHRVTNPSSPERRGEAGQ